MVERLRVRTQPNYNRRKEVVVVVEERGEFAGQGKEKGGRHEETANGCEVLKSVIGNGEISQSIAK